MPRKTFGVRRKYGSSGQFEVADVTQTVARQRAQELSQLSKNTAYIVVDVNTGQQFALYINGKEVG